MYSVIDNVHKAWRLFTRTSFHLQDADKACSIHKLIPLELKSATLFRNKKNFQPLWLEKIYLRSCTYFLETRDLDRCIGEKIEQQNRNREVYYLSER